MKRRSVIGIVAAIIAIQVAAQTPAPPPREKDLHRIVELSSATHSALLGGRWLVADGKLQVFKFPPHVLQPSPFSFLEGVSLLIYPYGEATKTSGGLGMLDAYMGPHDILISLPDQPHAPALAPDRRHVAYISALNRLQVVDLATKKVVDLSSAWMSRPSWSPDGKSIVFEKNKDRDQGWQDSEVAVVSASSGNVAVLDKGRFPSWSPDGNLIVYADVDGKQIRAIDPRTKKMRVLKKNWAAVMGPIEGPLVWSPDQTKLIFSREYDSLSGEHDKVYVLDIASGKITFLAKDEIVLDWR